MASAATTYGVLTVPTVSTPATNVELGTISISIDTLAPGTHSAVFTLPTDSVITDVYTFATGTGGAPTVTPMRTGYAGNESRIDVVATSVYTDVKITVKFRANLPNLSGDVKCDITNVGGGNSQLVDGSVVVARASSGEVTLSCPDVATLTSSGGTVKVTLKENVGGALKLGNGSLKLTLPPGFSWSTITVPTITDLATGGAASGITVAVDSDTRKLNVNVTAATSNAKTFRVEGYVNVDESTAKFGDVEVSVSSDCNTSYSPSSVLVANYADYGVSVKEKTSKEIAAGKKEQLIGEFTIEEAVKGSLIPNRTITLTLPTGVKWMFDSSNNPTNISYTCDKGSISLIGPTRVDDQTIKYTTPNTATSDATVIRFKDIKVNVAVDATGDVSITVGGSAGASGTVKVATIKPAVTATAASTPDVIIGEQGQVVGDVTITEGIKEALKSSVDSVPGYVYLTTPSGVKFAAVPTVAVSDGDLQLDSTATKLQDSDTVLAMKIKSSSTKPSTIKISGIKLTLDRTVPVGPLTLKVKGNAINETTTYFPASDTAAKVTVANCVTPAPGEQKGTAVFKIGDAKYTLNGKEFTMDAAPYIKDGRTMVPVRFAANAVGVADSNIIWDAAAKKVTVIKGDRVVQMTIGSKVMLINGATITMDTAPEISNDRTMLPVRFLGQALGAEFVWDEATQTVTVNF